MSAPNFERVTAAQIATASPLAGHAPYVTANGAVGQAPITDELNDCILDAARRMFRLMPDAVNPLGLAYEFEQRRAIIVLVESKGGEWVGAVAIGSLVIRDGQRFLAVNVDLMGDLGPSLEFFNYVEATALRDGLDLSILANGPLHVPHGYDFRDEGDGDRILTLKFKRN